MSLLLSLFENSDNPKQWIQNEINNNRFYDMAFSHMRQEDIGVVDEMRQEYESLYGYEDDEDDEDGYMNHEGEFESWLHAELMEKFSGTINYVTSMVGPDWNIPVWRAITITELNEIDLDVIGIFWSYDKSTAYPHFGKNSADNIAIIHASIDIRTVDWAVSLGQNMSYSFSDENEIRLNESAPIRIHAAEYQTKHGIMKDEFDPPKEARA